MSVEFEMMGPDGRRYLVRADNNATLIYDEEGEEIVVRVGRGGLADELRLLGCPCAE